MLKDSITAGSVAKLLGISRVAVHGRMKTGKLLAVLDRGVWRFPLWQFDPEGPDGVIKELPTILRALSLDFAV